MFSCYTTSVMHVMNPQVAPHSEEHDYLKVASSLLMILGGFHLLFSVISMSVLLFSPTISLTGDMGLLMMLNLPDSYILHTLVYGYVFFLVFFGWAIGLLTIQAGRDCLYTRSWCFVSGMTVLNWFCFPAGTTVGLMVWRDLRRNGVRQCFVDAASKP